MSWDFEDARERKERVRQEIAKRTGRGETFQQLKVPQGSRKLAATFWGRAWCDYLETYAAYEHRLPRGRSYLRQGNVYNLEITPGLVSATVAGAELYEARVHIQPVTPELWREVVKNCAGGVGSMLDLLAGNLGEDVLRVLTDPEAGLFPQIREIRFDCNCPDHADLCKHAAAVLYGVGVLLDSQPTLFFTLRSVDGAELLAAGGREVADGLVTGESGDLAGEDLGALFGIELE